MKRLAIVSSYNESCGNASYTHVLKNAFAEHVEVEVIPLDLFLLQKAGPFYAKHGDEHIEEIAEKLKRFDYVNIQFEAGLYAPTPAMVLKRITKLIKAAPRLVITMHRIDPPETTFWQSVGLALRLRIHPKDVFKKIGQNDWSHLYRQVIDLCAEQARRKPVSVTVHTPRELRIARDLYGCESVFLYPITFLREEERATILASQGREVFRQRHHVPEGVKVIGAFGFVSAYKAYETIIKTLTRLPDDYHLYIFGGQHPQSIVQHQPLDNYFKKLLVLIDQEEAALSKTSRKTERKDALSPVKLSDRVHFIGSLSDPEFIEALRFSDATVLPYMEVGQSMSGVIAIAIEAGANLFCSNNHSFNEVRKMYGEVYHTFDIGNYMELAEKIRIATRDYTPERDAAYAKYNIRESVRRHLDAMGHFTEQA